MLPLTDSPCVSPRPVQQCRTYRAAIHLVSTLTRWEQCANHKFLGRQTEEEPHGVKPGKIDKIRKLLAKT